LQFGTHETETVQPETVETNKPAEPVESMNLAFDHAMELLCFTMKISPDPGLPKMLREALSRRDVEKWKEALASKILNFLKHDAWRRVPMSQVLREGRKAIPTKPVFKIKNKQDGSEWYKARIMTKGFLMIPGVDYMESCSPVTTEVGVQCVIGISLYFINEDIVQNVPTECRWILELYNVEVAFLNANLGGKMYIKILDEMVELGYVTCEEQQLYAILLDQNMYRNVDAALQFFEKYSGILVTNLSLTQSQTDLCIFFKHDKAGKLNLLISTHVDDSLIGGRKWVMEAFFEQFVEYLKIERLGKLKKHLGV